MSTQEVKHVCRGCNQPLPAEAFFPSTLTRGKGCPYCRECIKVRDEKKRVQAYQEHAAKIRAVYGDGIWTAKQAGELVLDTAGSTLGAGALISAMVRRGIVAKVEEGKYTIANPGIAPLPSSRVEQQPLPSAPVATPFIATPPIAPVMHPQIEPVFLEVGAYVFSPGTFAIERDDRGGAVITLLVSETDLRTGKALPREIQLTTEEWKMRRRVTLTDIIDGNESTELFDRIGELERDVLHWRKECAAALALAQENEQDAAKYRKVVATIG